MERPQMPAGAPPSGGPYAHLVLALLVLVYVFDFIDRNILSILAEDICVSPTSGCGAAWSAWVCCSGAP